MPRILLTGLLLFVVCFGLAACDSDGLDDERTALLRLVHAADADTISVRLDNTSFDRLDFGETTAYRETEAGARLIEAVVEDNALIPFQEQLFFDRDSSYTLVLAGSEEDLTLLLTTDARRTPAGGQARVRLLHAASETGTIDAEITAADDVDTVLAVIDDLAFGAAGDALTLAPGTYTFFLDETSGTADTALDVTLATGHSYLLVLTDAAAGSTLAFIMADDQ